MLQTKTNHSISTRLIRNGINDLSRFLSKKETLERKVMLKYKEKFEGLLHGCEISPVLRKNIQVRICYNYEKKIDKWYWICQFKPWQLMNHLSLQYNSCSVRSGSDGHFKGEQIFPKDREYFSIRLKIVVYCWIYFNFSISCVRSPLTCRGARVCLSVRCQAGISQSGGQAAPALNLTQGRR